MKRFPSTLLALILLFSVGKTHAQEVILEPHDPRKAAILSAVLPGAGQFYNKKWWKAPIVYAGLGFTVYSIITNQNQYNTYKSAYILRTDEDPNTVDPFDPNNTATPINQRYTEANLRTLLEYYQRNRDLSYVGTFAVYMLQIIDANVDAHLFNFDVSEDISLNVQPSFMQIGYNQQVTGVKLKFSF